MDFFSLFPNLSGHSLEIAIFQSFLFNSFLMCPILLEISNFLSRKIADFLYLNSLQDSAVFFKNSKNNFLLFEVDTFPENHPYKVVIFAIHCKYIHRYPAILPTRAEGNVPKRERNITVCMLTCQENIYVYNINIHYIVMMLKRATLVGHKRYMKCNIYRLEGYAPFQYIIY